jgi:hypothetical protein
MLRELADWLSQTYLSGVFSDTTHLGTWLIIPMSQSMHIMSIAIIMISVGILNLRLLGVAGTSLTIASVTRRLTPWIWGALFVLLVTGTVQTIAEPDRELLNMTFGLKMVMLAIVIAITAFYQTSIRKDAHYWERSFDRQRAGQLLAVLSLVLWLAIVAAGRLIAYFDLGQYL